LLLSTDVLFLNSQSFYIVDSGQFHFNLNVKLEFALSISASVIPITKYSFPISSEPINKNDM
jgi:hypothetical protein